MTRHQLLTSAIPLLTLPQQSPEPRVVEISSDDDVVISTHAFGHAPRSSSNPATAASFNAFDKKALTSRSSLEAPLPASKTLVLRPPVVQPESSRSPPEAPASSPDVMVLRSSKVAKAARSSLGASPKAPDVKPSQSSNTFETNRSSTETPAPTREVKTLQSSSVPTTAHPAHAAPTSSGTMVLRSAHVNSTATAPLAAIFTRRRPFGPRRPEFDGLVGRRLLNAMKDLPRWEQAQACNAFFDESEVMLLYLADVQTISTSWRPPRGGRDPMVAAMAAGGFKPLRAGSSSSYTSPLNTAGLNLRLCLAALNAAPVVIQPNNPYGAPVSSFLLRGPVEVRVFTLNDYHTSPGSLLKSARPIWAVGMPGACLSAKFDAFYDPVIRSYFADYYFGRLRLLDPTLKPWKFDQTIESVNPQLADPSHPLRGCTQVFWSSGYHDPDRTTLASVNEPSVLVYCREHDRKEGFNMCSARMFKLSSGYFTHQEWLDGTYDLHKSNDAFRTTHGSHPCGNGKWCLALFEMVWEPVRYNMGRKSCHETAADVEDGFCDCHVCRMTGVPCNLAAHRMDPSVLRSRNMAIINDHFADGSINSCAICLEQISTASNIEEYMGPALRVMREHLRERHGHTDEWASLVARW